MSDSDREALARLLNDHRWRSHPDHPELDRRSAHAGHKYDGSCGICRGSIEDIAAVIVGAGWRPPAASEEAPEPVGCVIARIEQGNPFAGVPDSLELCSDFILSLRHADDLLHERGVLESGKPWHIYQLADITERADRG